MVIPIYDNDPLEKSHRAYVTFTLIALNIAIFIFQDSASDKTSTLLLVNFALSCTRKIARLSAISVKVT